MQIKGIRIYKPVNNPKSGKITTTYICVHNLNSDEGIYIINSFYRLMASLDKDAQSWRNLFRCQVAKKERIELLESNNGECLAYIKVEYVLLYQHQSLLMLGKLLSELNSITEYLLAIDLYGNQFDWTHLPTQRQCKDEVEGYCSLLKNATREAKRLLKHYNAGTIG